MIVTNLETLPIMITIPIATGRQMFTGLSGTIAVVHLPLVTTVQDHRNLVNGTTSLDGNINDLLRVHHRGTKAVVIP